MDVLTMFGLADRSSYYSSSLGDGTFRNYVRGLGVFDSLLSESRFTIKDMNTFDNAVKVFAEVLQKAFDKKFTLSKVMIMKTSVSRLFSFVLNSELSQHALIKAMLHSYNLENLPIKRPLHIEWSITQLLSHISSRPSWSLLSHSELTGICIVLFMIFSAARFTEIQRIPLLDSNPDANCASWSFMVKVKGHNFLEPIVLFSTNDVTTDPIPALLCLRDRIKLLLPERYRKENRFWYKVSEEDTTLMSYSDIRYAAANVLKSAGLPHQKPYRIKHAVMTYLSQNGADARDLAAFARHSLQSMTAYKHYVDYDRGEKSVAKIAAARK
jgi:site-specific recombinase XerD